MKKKILILSFTLFANNVFASKCNLEKVPASLKDLVQIYRDMEKVTLGEKLPKKFKSPSEEFIFRATAKNWQGYDWKLRPLEIQAISLAQEKYAVYCETFPKKILNEVTADFTLGKIPAQDKKIFLRNLLLFLPCTDGDESQVLQAITASEFNKNTEDFVELLIATESEAPQYTADYKACSALNQNSKFPITDNFLRGMDYYTREFGIEKNLVLKLKRLRSSDMHFETAKYLFQRLDEMIGI